ncbi:hypothetical protein I4U23_030827 [Adineta vaga]|nr:hypothetical protein I4U23_030827 [Adineta vaga]
MLWTYFDTNINLHAGFSWMGTGSIFLREHAQRHLRFLQIHLKDNPELWAFSDVFFSIWLNDIPTQLIVTLYPLTIDQNEQTNGNLSSNQIVDLQRTSSIFAIRRLEYSLRLNQSNTNLTFSRYQSRRFPYLTKSSNSNDNFIFFSNILPIDIEHIPFDISIDVERATYANIPRGPNFIHFVNHNTLKATDNDDRTCWYPRKSVEKGDFFAIDFLSIQTNLTIVLMMNHSEKLQNTLDIRLSFDGQWWISYPFAIQKNSKTNNAIIRGTLRRLIIDSRQFPPELRSFRYIAFNATTHFHENFSVCDVKIFKNL